MNNTSLKKIVSAAAIAALILAIYVMAFFIIPFPKNASAWISFVFTLISIICGFFCSLYSFASAKTAVSKLYGFPIFRVGILYAIIQFLVGLVICLVGMAVNVPYWVALLLSLVLFCAAIIGFVVTDNTRDVVEEMDEALAVSTMANNQFRISIDGIVDYCSDATLRTELVKLAEEFRYSDPVSVSTTESIEAQLEMMLDELRTMVAYSDVAQARNKIREISLALAERNRICKANKH